VRVPSVTCRHARGRSERPRSAPRRSVTAPRCWTSNGPPGTTTWPPARYGWQRCSSPRRSISPRSAARRATIRRLWSRRSWLSRSARPDRDHAPSKARTRPGRGRAPGWVARVGPLGPWTYEMRTPSTIRVRGGRSHLTLTAAIPQPPPRRPQMEGRYPRDLLTMSILWGGDRLWRRPAPARRVIGPAPRHPTGAPDRLAHERRLRSRAP
jgi:hypothetical protein